MTTAASPRTAPHRAAQASSAAKKKRKKASRLGTIAQLFGAFRGTGRWWLTPLIVVLLVVAVALVVVQIAQYAAPFVYTLF